MARHRFRTLPFDDEEFEAYAELLNKPENRQLRVLLPTTTQLETLHRMIETNRPLIYHGNDKWSFSQMPADSWCVSLGTVRAMERRGWLRRKEISIEWQDTRELTETGKALPLALWQAKARGESLLTALQEVSGKNHNPKTLT
jgi:hypothetical protein